QQPVGPLDRDQLHLQAHQRSAQGPQTLLIVRERRRQQPLARRVRDEHIVLLRRPVNAGVTSHLNLPLLVNNTSQRPDREVPLRMPIDKALTRAYVLLPLAAPHHRREGLVHERPSTPRGRQSKALSRRRSRQQQG